MMSILSAKDLYAGKILGHLKLLRRVRRNPNHSPATRTRWRAECLRCGTNITIPQSYVLRKDNPRTDCGCVGEEAKSLQAKNKREYSIWYMMNRRCTDETHVAYKNYGGRGISVAQQWRLQSPNAFDLFFGFMGNAPTRKHTLDRIDVDGNYEPGNVRWATPKEQAMNTRRQKRLRELQDGKRIS
jgi:hypothetical protein